MSVIQDNPVRTNAPRADTGRAYRALGGAILASSASFVALSIQDAVWMDDKVAVVEDRAGPVRPNLAEISPNIARSIQNGNLLDAGSWANPHLLAGTLAVAFAIPLATIGQLLGNVWPVAMAGALSFAGFLSLSVTISVLKRHRDAEG